MQVEIAIRNESSYQFCTCQFYGYTRNSAVKGPIKLAGRGQISQFPYRGLKIITNQFLVSLIILIVCRLTLKIHYNLIPFKLNLRTTLVLYIQH